MLRSELVRIADGQWKTLYGLLIDGADQETAASRRGVSVNTVKMDLKRIYARLGVNNITALAVLVWSGQLKLVNRTHGDLLEALNRALRQAA